MTTCVGAPHPPGAVEVADLGEAEGAADLDLEVLAVVSLRGGQLLLQQITSVKQSNNQHA